MDSYFGHVGSNVRKLMKKKGITVSVAAKQLEMSPSGVYDIFKRRQINDESLLERISVLLSEPVPTILSYEVNRLPPLFSEREEPDQRMYFEVEKVVMDLRREIEFLRQQIIQKDALLSRLLEKIVE